MAENKEQIWHDWLYHPATGEMILSCLRGIVAKGRARGYPLEAWPYEYDEEVVDGLWLTLKKRSRNPPLTLVHLILNQKYGALCNYLQDLVFDRHRDILRKTDPWQAMYRLFRQVLAKTDGISYCPNHRGSWYAWTLEPDLKKEDLADEDFSSWPKPDLDLRRFRNREGVRYIAQHIWKEVSRRKAGPRLIPIKAVIDCLQAHFPAQFEKPHQIDPLVDFVSEGTDPMDLMPVQVNQDLEVTRKNLDIIAEACAWSLTPRQRKILAWRMEDSTLKLIADEMQVSISTVSNEMNRISDCLRQRCSLWPGLAADDLDEQLFNEFTSKLVEFCKDLPEDRLRGMRAFGESE